MTTRTKERTAIPQYFRGVRFGQRYSAHPELHWDDESKPCTVCKGPTNWRRPRKRGAATHPWCEGTVFDAVTEDLHADALFTISAALGIREITEQPAVPRATRARRTAPLGDPDAGCQVCGKGFSACWLAARIWLCPEHSLLPIRYPRWA